MSHPVRGIGEVTGMTIHNVGGPGSPQKPEPPGKPKGAGPRDARAPDRGDRVELSPQARRISSLARKAMSLPEIRQEKIEALRAALAGDTQAFDARALARAILEFEDGLSR